jgi:hypothetical protein
VKFEAAHISRGASWFASATQGNSLIARRVIPMSADLYRSRTVRPTYSVLSNALMLQTFGIELGDWRCQYLRCLSGEQLDHEFEIPQKSSTSVERPPRPL